MKIGIIDYDINNLASVINAINKLGHDGCIVKDASKLKDFDKIILPGVGSFGDAMHNLKQHNMDDAIIEFVKSGKYILGICLGMQLFFEKSYEFEENSGLGLIKSSIKYFDKKDKYKIPHIGWNRVFCDKNAIFEGLADEIYLYFVHSLFAPINRYTIGSTLYANEFSAVINRDNIYGIQAHPEKSHDIGLKLIDNFIKL
jgi:glutamine amidotransferase